MSGPGARHSALPTAVRGRRAPIEYGGIPRSSAGWTWGMSVATRTPASSAASAGASVRMSATTASGRDLLHAAARSSRVSGSAAS